MSKLAISNFQLAKYWRLAIGDVASHGKSRIANLLSIAHSQLRIGSGDAIS